MKSYKDYFKPFSRYIGSREDVLNAIKPQNDSDILDILIDGDRTLDLLAKYYHDFNKLDDKLKAYGKFLFDCYGIEKPSAPTDHSPKLYSQATELRHQKYELTKNVPTIEKARQDICQQNLKQLTPKISKETVDYINRCVPENIKADNTYVLYNYSASNQESDLLPDILTKQTTGISDPRPTSKWLLIGAGVFLFVYIILKCIRVSWGFLILSRISSLLFGLGLLTAGIILYCKLSDYEEDQRKAYFNMSERPRILEMVAQEYYRSEWTTWKTKLDQLSNEISVKEEAAKAAKASFIEKTKKYDKDLEEYSKFFNDHRADWDDFWDTGINISKNITYICEENHYQIPDKYNLYTLKEIFDDKRAETFKEAFNVYIADEKADELVRAERRRTSEIERHNMQMEEDAREAQQYAQREADRHYREMEQAERNAHREQERHNRELERQQQEQKRQQQEQEHDAARRARQEANATMRRGASQCGLCRRSDCRMSMRSNNDGHCTSFIG